MVVVIDTKIGAASKTHRGSSCDEHERQAGANSVVKEAAHSKNQQNCRF
jgi:hypothetical protein